MTNVLDRRLRKLEASAKAADGEGTFRWVFVPVGSTAEAETAKLTDRRAGEELFFVHFVRAADIPSPATLQ